MSRKPQTSIGNIELNQIIGYIAAMDVSNPIRGCGHCIHRETHIGIAMLDPFS
jgi:hypothetical protein